jgi:integrase
MGAAEIEAFLTHLAVEGQVSASTQNQAFHALLFLYQQVLNIELPRIDAVHAKRPERLPVVMSRSEVRQVLEGVVGASGLFQLMAQLQYGSGLRLMESCRVRVHDVDLERGQVMVRAGKGDKDRVVCLPGKLRPSLDKVLQWRQNLHQQDLGHGCQEPFLARVSGTVSASAAGRKRFLTPDLTPDLSKSVPGTRRCRPKCPWRPVRCRGDSVGQDNSHRMEGTVTSSWDVAELLPNAPPP